MEALKSDLAKKILSCPKSSKDLQEIMLGNGDSLVYNGQKYKVLVIAQNGMKNFIPFSIG